MTAPRRPSARRASHAAPPPESLAQPARIDTTVARANWFWDQVAGQDDPDGHWLWTRGVNDSGYGVLRLLPGRTGPGSHIYAHRLAYILDHGGRPIPPGPDGIKLFVCHACDVPRCCNPAHLRLCTYLENAADMVRRGRHPKLWRGKIPKDVLEYLAQHPESAHRFSTTLGLPALLDRAIQIVRWLEAEGVHPLPSMGRQLARAEVQLARAWAAMTQDDRSALLHRLGLRGTDLALAHHPWAHAGPKFHARLGLVDTWRLTRGVLKRAP